MDDEKLVRWSISEKLTRAGYEVDSAGTGDEALELLAARAPDVMLLDVQLPGVDGVAVLRRALALHPSLVVVMMSAHSAVEVVVEAMQLGAVDFLVKPFATAALQGALTRASATVELRWDVAEVGEDGAGQGLGSIIGTSAQVEELRRLAARVAASSASTVLIEGESGVGKEVLSRAIHYESGGMDRPFVQVNCAALPESLLESELFGHERGAFTDAKAQKLGLFETASGGTVMLDEIGELPPSGQAKLLLLLENRTLRRVGGVAEVRTDVRVIAATNVDLEQRVAEGRFRADLFFRLNVVRLQVPPLRERKSDIGPLTAHFIARYNQQLDRNVRGVSSRALELLMSHDWPGNIRELRNHIERAFILNAEVDELRPEHLSLSMPPGGHAPPRTEAERDFVWQRDSTERRLIAEAMERARGNQSQAARDLGLSRDMLRYRLKKFGLG